MSRDYVSDNLSVPDLSAFFPNRVAGDKTTATWPYFRREIGHAWYVDRRDPQIGFINKDEAAVLYANACLFKGKPGLEVGAWRGWSSAHLVATGLASLHIVDPMLADPAWRQEFAETLARVAGPTPATLVGEPSPEAVVKLGEGGQRWAFAFIDGDHDGDAPVRDALACQNYLAPTAMVVFHDLASPHVAAGLRALAEEGWSTVVYQTAQIMGAAWRGAIAPTPHRPDPKETWRLPDHLAGFALAPTPG
jgi:hypothetical protein